MCLLYPVNNELLQICPHTGGLREAHPTVPTVPPMSLPNPNLNLNPNPKIQTNPNPI